MKLKENIKSRHGIFRAFLAALALLLGLSLLLYPTVADYISSLNFKEEIETYREKVSRMDDSGRLLMLDKAREYNERLLSRSERIGELSAEQKKEYESLLDPSGSGMMGYIVIKKAEIYLPVYHGTSESVLQSGIGHIEGSSLPVGGAGTHAVLSGHTGLPSSKLFSNIDRLKKGDLFELHVMGEVLTYRVESTVVLPPQEAGRQKIDPQKDLCTLMTCTPYGINTHRLLVNGIRTDTPDDKPPGGVMADEEIPAPVPAALKICAIAVPLAMVISFILLKRRKRKRK